MDNTPLKPLVVSNSTAKRLLDVGNTKYWSMVKAGKIQLVDVCGRRMAVYASLEALAQPQIEAISVK